MKYIVLMGLILGTTVSPAEEADPMQQIANYLGTCNAAEGSSEMGQARIFDRKQCVLGFEDNAGGYYKLYMNNVDVEGITISRQYQNGQVVPYLELTGSKTVFENRVENGLLAMGFASLQIDRGNHNQVKLGLQNCSAERLREALDLLYSDYCEGQASAF